MEHYRERLKDHKAPGVDLIPSELIHTGGGKLYQEIHKLNKITVNLLVRNKKELPQEWKEPIII